MPEFEEAIDRIMTGLEKKKRLMNKKGKGDCRSSRIGSCAGGVLFTARRPGTKNIDDSPWHRSAWVYITKTYRRPIPDDKGRTPGSYRHLTGGRIAEEIIFNEISTGAQNDLEKATEIAKMMVKEYGHE